MEKILQPNESRFVLFPLQYFDIWRMYKLSVQSQWTADHVDLSKDIEDWNNKLDDNQRHFLKTILAFFAASDGIVLENLITCFSNEIPIPEVRCFYSHQAFMENVHSEMYSLLIDTYITDKSEKTHLLNAIQTIPCIEKKANWALKWINPDIPFAMRLIAFAIVEGVFFSGSFASIYYIKEKGILHGLCTSNDYISKDEGLHVNFACLLFTKYIEHKPTRNQVLDILKEAIAIEKEFLTEALPVGLIGMNSDLMCQYIEFVADFVLENLGYKKFYNVKNPFYFMVNISLTKLVNFFEHRPTEYKMESGSKKEDVLTFDSEF